MSNVLEKINKLGTIRTTWRDYTLQLLNSSDENNRINWQEKLVTSIQSWSFGIGSANDSLVAGVEILSELPNYLTKKIVDDVWTYDMWYRVGRLPGSKKQKLVLGHYAQEAHMVEANKVLSYIIDNYDEINPENGRPIGELLWTSKYIRKIWEFAQKSGGEIIYPSESLLYTLEKDTDPTIPAFWTDIAEDVFTNGIPSTRYAKQWKSDKMAQFPVGNFYKDENLYKDIENNWEYPDSWWKVFGNDYKAQAENMHKVLDKFFKEDLSNSPCWKRFAVVILKLDLSGKYMGFGPTLRERKMREEAMSSYSQDKDEQEKSLKEVELLNKKIEKEEKSMASTLAEVKKNPDILPQKIEIQPFQM